MKPDLPNIEKNVFFDRIRDAVPNLESKTLEALFEHYQELQRWNARLSLIGPGTFDEVIQRHYVESLLGLSLLKSEDQTILDFGSGGGFPGFVLSAAYPEKDVVLVEARQKKWAFLKSAIRRSGLSSRCLNARVEASLPQGTPDLIDVVTCRAVVITPRLLGLFRDHSPRVRFLLWLGSSQPEVPEGLAVLNEVALPGSDHRRILELGPET